MSNARNLATLLGTNTALPTSKMPSGSILQVKSSTMTDTFENPGTSFADVTGLSATITPLSTNSKILVMVGIVASADTSGYIHWFRLLRGTTVICKNTGSGSAATYEAFFTSGGVNISPGGDRVTDTISISHLDSPSTTSATTYKVQVKESGGAGYVNRWAINDDKGSTSTITLMEIAG